MSLTLLPPEKMLDVIPGEVVEKGTVDTAPSKGMSIRGYRFYKTEVNIPCMRDYELVRWKKGTSNLGFHNGSKWQKNAVHDDDVTILTRGESSRWYWMNDIEVSHIYISQSLMAKVAAEIFQKDIDRIFVDHYPIINDAALSRLMESYESESLSDEPGSGFYAQALEIQLCIHLIRRYMKCIGRDKTASCISKAKLDALQRYITTHLAATISVKDMAAIVGLSPSHFVRVFGTIFGVSPHQYVQAQRLKRAERLLALHNVPLKAVAMDCGFADQSHMTRLFKEKLSMTPKEYREKRACGLFCSLTVQ
ncbi:AraC family transcriptional regulator [Pseudomonas duriflava]|uniref:AraC family transcriptional regulator n=1 Tax=Pseudomonas duriflava TaxID=459528 RepID=A0A562PU89_9PSED|nr:AraC family transcriptional regulator [Pseudomonas duriflava]TWI47969.1 AraC family transcriptional regulator [Pseudomonas duriflava]